MTASARRMQNTNAGSGQCARSPGEGCVLIVSSLFSPNQRASWAGPTRVALVAVNSSVVTFIDNYH